jgi:predicted acyltransferase
MILVNNPGDWSRTFGPLLHADWHGWTATDLVFPFFLFVMGVAMPFAFKRRLESPGGSQGLFRKVARRTLLLFALGLFSGWFPFVGFDWATARIPGVLQRIAVVYLFASLAYLHLRVRARVWLTSGLLAGYWILMKLVPVPGFGAGDLSPAGNLASWIDNLVLGSHVWLHAPGDGDPEGILSTIPAVATALIGVFIGEFLASRRSSQEKLRGLMITGVAGILLGLLTGQWFPINKNLWTSSYVLFTAGMALALLAIIYYVVDIKGHDGWAAPFRIFGMNSIAAYVGSGLLARILLNIKWADPDGAGLEGATVTLQKWLYRSFVEPVFPDYWASFAWAMANVLLWLAIMGVLYRRRIFIKI